MWILQSISLNDILNLSQWIIVKNGGKIMYNNKKRGISLIVVLIILVITVLIITSVVWVVKNINEKAKNKK